MSNIVGMDITQIDTSPLFGLGQVGRTSNGNLYRYCQYEAGSAAVSGVAGEVAYYDGAGASSTFVVTSDLSDSVNIGAGVLQAILADGEYGWLQTRGPATLTIALTAGSDGNALTAVGAGDGTLDVSGAVTDFVCAVADDISAKKIICMFP
jgi:hypothetical protein